MPHKINIFPLTVAFLKYFSKTYSNKSKEETIYDFHLNENRHIVIFVSEIIGNDKTVIQKGKFIYRIFSYTSTEMIKQDELYTDITALEFIKNEFRHILRKDKIDKLVNNGNC